MCSTSGRLSARSLEITEPTARFMPGKDEVFEQRSQQEQEQHFSNL